MVRKNKKLTTPDDKRLAAFTKINPRPVVEVSLRGTVLYMNTAAQKLFPDLRKLGTRHPYLADFKKITRLLIDKQFPQFSREVNINEHWFRHFFYYLPEFNSILIYGTDITDRKQAEMALAKSELRYRSLFNKMSESYVLYEMVLNGKGAVVDCKFLDMNPAFEKNTGLKKSLTIGKTIKQVLPPKEHGWIKEYGKVALTGKSMHGEQHDKERNKYYEVFAHKPDELQTAVLSFDITERHKIIEEKDNFISIMSHELRNPLTPILTSAQALNSFFSQGNPAVKKYAHIIERQAKNMAKLLDDLLDTSRMAHKKLQLDKKIVNVNDIVANAVETTLPHVKEQEQELSVTVPKQPIYVAADPVRLEQILVNLITNAVKYTRPKGHIWISISRSNGWVEITVRDNGIGIKPEKIKKIFELFQTLDQVPFAKLGSIGIGLNITKQLVVMHGGKIIVTSKGENKGSTFTVRLPRTTTRRMQLPLKLPQKPAPQKTPKKILVADDHKDIANLVSSMLTSHGYHVSTVYNGQDAIKTYKSFKPDAALIDIRMSDMTGYRVARTIKQQKNGHTATLIALTGYGQAKDRQLSKEAGFDHHLTKPVDMNSLTKLLGSL